MVDAGGMPADVAAWTKGAQRFHDLIMERAGNRTLAIQSMVLREVVETHLLLATRSTADAVAAVSGFAKLIRSFRKLVRLVQAGDDVAAQQHWQAHMEVVGRSLLPDRLKSATVLDLFS
jgi:DNA-binding FadR family transcriptional regulator